MAARRNKRTEEDEDILIINEPDINVEINEDDITNNLKSENIIIEHAKIEKKPKEKTKSKVQSLQDFLF